MKRMVLVFTLVAAGTVMTVTEAAAQSKSFKYARLGYGTVFGDE